ncbi:CHAP domain-containing protein [Piscinibacter gummiphilus]|uniref:Amidase n=1 Tax=Piscinibacter gummiphilus TaxID=946333 RepID=A0A1W6LBZ8_9BURK|nr:CHAP domain-containing protein [Piscinibacter gummiphilus]ARN21717.1 amidase [Piscinibacter gummiphilus]ATU66403.1 CHAP domain-containing protein [Piscinibacter gummiphilus]GLS95710.1 CHAP domain-containing protein [Piscinibacter gummiphilus]
MTRTTKALLLLAAFVAAGYFIATRFNINPAHTIGEPLDELNGVAVYYNGAINNTSGRRTTEDGYNLGLKFQCVEFVKRYYYERFNHKMPNAMGHAKEFFSPAVADGELNKDRMLLQYRNGAGSRPLADDLIVFAPWALNRFGHVAIVSQVGDDFIEVIQQNPGPFGSTRERFPLERHEGQWRVGHDRVQGWLRREPPTSPSVST